MNQSVLDQRGLNLPYYGYVSTYMHLITSTSVPDFFILKPEENQCTGTTQLPLIKLETKARPACCMLVHKIFQRTRQKKKETSEP